MAVKKTVEVVGIQLPKLQLEEIIIQIVGDSPLIVHRWDEKAIRMILNKQLGKAQQGKVAKDPAADFENSMYRFPNGDYGFPSVGFKNSAVTACTSLSGITKISARQSFRVIGESTPVKTVFNGVEMRSNLVRIEGVPEMREDLVRIGMGVADIRYRAQFVDWRCNLRVLFNKAVLSREQVVNLFNTAGFAVGVGEWRQERNGEYGAFHVELMSQEELDKVNGKKAKRA